MDPVPNQPHETKRRGSPGRKRLPTEVRQERLRFAAEQFRLGYDYEKQKTLSVPKVNSMVKAKFGAMLNAQDLINLRESVMRQIQHPQQAPPAARQATEPKRMEFHVTDKSGKPLLVDLRDAKTPADGVVAACEALRARDQQLTVDFVGEGYAIIK